MPSPIAHTALGYVVYRVFKPRFASAEGTTKPWDRRFLALSVGLSLLPDLDFIPGLLTYRVGDFHNAASHSPVMALLVAAAVAALVWARDNRRWRDVFVYVFVAYGLHVLADFFTLGRGTMLFWPLSLERIAPPFHIFYGLHRSAGLISSQHLITLANELIFVGAVLAAMWGIDRLRRMRQSRTTDSLAV